MVGFEPEILRFGKAFGVEVQTAYPAGARDVVADAELTVSSVSELTGRRRTGRIDLVLEGFDDASGLPFRVVIEIKNTDWDRQAPHRVRPNLGRHRRQLWRYLDAELARLDAGELAWVQGALIYPCRPQTPGRGAEVEARLEEHMITVAWYDELS